VEAYAGTETGALRPTCLLPAARGPREAVEAMTQFPSGRGHLLSAFRPPCRARPRPRLEDLPPLLDGGGFRKASVSPTPAQPEVLAEHAQLSAGACCDVSARQHEHTGQPSAPQQWPLQKARNTYDRSDQRLYTDLLFQRTAAPVSAADLPLGPGSRSRRAIPLYSLLAFILGPWQHDDAARPGSSAGGHASRACLLEMHRWTLFDLGLADGALARITPERSSITARCRSDRIPRRHVFLPMHWVQAGVGLRGPNALCIELACRSPAAELKARRFASSTAAAVMSARSSAGPNNQCLQQGFV